jgi:hypothetical protein
MSIWTDCINHTVLGDLYRHLGLAGLYRTCYVLARNIGYYNSSHKHNPNQYRKRDLLQVEAELANRKFKPADVAANESGMGRELFAVFRRGVGPAERGATIFELG